MPMGRKLIGALLALGVATGAASFGTTTPVSAKAAIRAVCTGPEVTVMAKAAVKAFTQEVRLEEQNRTVNPYLYQGKTYAPYGRLFELIGGTVYWDPDTEYASLSYQDALVRVRVRNDLPNQLELLNRKNLDFTLVPLQMFTCQSRLFGPVREILEAVGIQSEAVLSTPTWENYQRLVLIDMTYQPVRLVDAAVSEPCLEKSNWLKELLTLGSTAEPADCR